MQQYSRIGFAGVLCTDGSLSRGLKLLCFNLMGHPALTACIRVGSQKVSTLRRCKSRSESMSERKDFSVFFKDSRR